MAVSPGHVIAMRRCIPVVNIPVIKATCLGAVHQPQRVPFRARGENSCNLSVARGSPTTVMRMAFTSATRQIHTSTGKDSSKQRSKASLVVENSLTSDPSTWNGSSLLTVEQIAPSGLSLLYETTRSMRAVVRKFGGDDLLQHKLLAAVFYGEFIEVIPSSIFILSKEES